MIRHLIVFNIRDGMSHEECVKIIELGRERLSQIPGVVGISFGVSVSEAAKYRYMLAVDFADESVIETYKHHPIHVQYADEHFRPMAVDRITTDYRIFD